MAKTAKPQIREEDLYRPVRQYLTEQGYAVNGEVADCDVTAVKDGQLIIIELKRSLNLELILQAVKRQKTADGVYVAVPHPGKQIMSSRWRDVCHLLKRLEVGLMVVAFSKKEPQLRIEFHPVEFDRDRSRKASRKKRHALIEEIRERHGDYNTGGSVRKKLMTAYREKAIHIACCLEKHGPLAPKQLRLMGTDARTGDILRYNHYGWFEKVEKGVYSLASPGREALLTYAGMADIYRKEILEGQENKNSGT